MACAGLLETLGRAFSWMRLTPPAETILMLIRLLQGSYYVITGFEQSYMYGIAAITTQPNLQVQKHTNYTWKSRGCELSVFAYLRCGPSQWRLRALRLHKLGQDMKQSTDTTFLFTYNNDKTRKRNTTNRHTSLINTHTHTPGSIEIVKIAS